MYANCPGLFFKSVKSTQVSNLPPLSGSFIQPNNKCEQRQESILRWVEISLLL
jgi:hypothetical protein